jgi:histidine triad (HIT) family protein
MSDCIFCKIITGELPGDIVYKTDTVTAFRDIHPAAPTHILIVTNKHIADNNDFSAEDGPLAAALFNAVREIAAQEGVAEDGYRLIANTGPHGRQEVPHLHLHLIGGQKMQHPLG